MDKELKFSFCIIKNPFLNGERNIIFVSKPEGTPSTEAMEQEFGEIRDALNIFGYTETSELKFESPDYLENLVTPVEIIEFLESLGMSYSRELEVDSIKKLSPLKETEVKLFQKERYEMVKYNDNQANFNYSEPDIGDKVSLYFYLFLEFGFTSSMKPIIQLGGDFMDSLNYDDRNYLKIVKSDFIRVFDSSKPNSIILSSCKKQDDFVKESGLLYSGHFIHQKRSEVNGKMTFTEEKNVYKLLEVRGFLVPDQPIVIEVNKVGYEKLIQLSKAIKKEMAIETRKMISVDDIKIRAANLTSSFDSKIKPLLIKEDFESIIKIKQNIDFINRKVKLVEDSGKLEITTKEYFKIFHMP